MRCPHHQEGNKEMATIKKAYQDIITLFQDNEDSFVRDILPQVTQLASAKTGGGGGKATTFHRDENGKVVGIQCYYHKLWMDPEVAEFGKKASSATGYNSMCKDGVSKWTKQQRDAKRAKEQLLLDVSNGDIEAADLPALLAEIEEASDVIIPRDDNYGFSTLEELLDSQA
jgi:uncharacterized protein YuzE